MRSRLLALSMLGAFAGLQLPGALLGRPLYFRDTSSLWLPQVDAFVSCVGMGSLPTWDPFTSFGRPLLADPRAAVLYPPTWLNLLFAPATYYALFAIGHLVLGGAGLALLVRALGTSRGAALCAAGVWIASGPTLSMVAMWAHHSGAAYVPWIVWAFLRLAERPSARRLAAAAALLALEVVGGSPEMGAIAAVGAGLFLLVPPAGGRPRPASALAMAAAALLGLAIGAAQWLPTARVVAASVRWEYPRAAATTWSLHPLAVPETVLPVRWFEQQLAADARREILGDRQPFLLSIYLGAASLPLVAAALCRRRRVLVVPAALVVLGVVLALGRHGPADPLVAALPVVRAFRYPVKALVMTTLGWSLLAGVGFDRLRSGARRERVVAAAAAATLATGAALVLAVLHGALPRVLPAWIEGPVAPPLPASIALLLALGGASLAALRSGTSWWPAPCLAVLALADLTLAHRDLNPTGPRMLWERRPATLAALDRAAYARTFVQNYDEEGVPQAARLQAHELARGPRGLSEPEIAVLAYQEALNTPTAGRWRVFGSFERDNGGIDSKALAEVRRRFRRGTPQEQHALLRLAAVRNFVALLPELVFALTTPAAELPGFFAEPVRVRRVEAPRPRAYLVDGVRIGEGVDALLDPAFDPEREVLLPRGEARASAGPAGSAAIARFACDAVTVEVEAARPARLVLVDAWDPGWEASVDGAPAAVSRANEIFRSVEVPAGRHTVDWRYVPEGLRAGALVSGVAVVAAALLALRGRGRGAAAGRTAAPEGGATSR